jgi:hypothetical protein
LWRIVEYGHHHIVSFSNLDARKRSANRQAKWKKGRNIPTLLSLRSMKACHSTSIAFLQSIAKIGTQSPIKSTKKTL